MIPPETVSKIHEAADIVDVVGEFVNLKRAGANYKGLCPFHDEKTPSFMVAPAKQIYKCFGCGASGKAVKFVMEHEKFTYPEALRWLAKKYHIEIEERELTGEEIAEKKQRESLLIINNFARKYFTEQLHDTEEGKNIGLSYFRERGFTDASIKKFNLGWSPRKRDAFTQTALAKGYKQSLLEKTGLTIVKKESNYMFDRFAERVIFPIMSLSGQTLAFGGRTLRSDKKTAKYLNSPESDIYHKSNVLYGIYQAKESIRKNDKCYLTEGYTDVISMHQAGVSNTLASSGTALTVSQLRLIRRFTKNLTIVFDGDEAGINAALKGINLALSLELNVRVVLLPEGNDPDTFAKSKSSDELIKYLETKAQNFILFKAEQLKGISLNEPVKRAQLMSDMMRSVAEVPSQILRAEYIRQAAKLLETDEKSLYTELARIMTERFDQIKKQNYRKKEKQPRRHTPQIPNFVKGIYSESNETELLKYLFNYGNHVIAEDDETGERLTVAQFIVTELKNENMEFRNLQYKKIFEEYDALFYESETGPTDYFLEHEDELVREKTLKLIEPEKELSKIWEERGSAPEKIETRLIELIPDAVEKYKLKLVEEKKLLLKEELKNQPERMKEIIDEMIELDEIRKKLIDFTGKLPLL